MPAPLHVSTTAARRFLLAHHGLSATADRVDPGKASDLRRSLSKG